MDSSMPPPPHTSSSPVKPAPHAPQHQSRRNNRKDYQDVNHLLGFTLPPRAPPPPAGPRRSAKRNPNHGVYDKQRYVSSTFRFVVKPTSDYTALFADPDLHIAWEDILQIIVDTTSALTSASTSTIDQPVERRDRHDGGAAIPTCPICLSEPTAPRMTKCGHIFCLPCMLHYLALAQGTKWRKCPVCWDAVYAKDLKAVKWHDPVSASSSASHAHPDRMASPSTSPLADALTHTHLSSDQTLRLPAEPLKMRLVRRPQITTLALPRSPTWPSDAVPSLRAPWTFTPDALSFAKFILGAPDYMKAELERDLTELQVELAGLERWGDELGTMFAKAAIEKVKEQVLKTDEMKTQAVMTVRKRVLKELTEVKEKLEARDRFAEAMKLPLLSETEASSSEPEVEPETEEEQDNAPHEFLASRHVPGAGTPSVPIPLRRSNLPSTAALQQPSTDVDSSYFYYQAASGQNIFLQPLDIRVLKSHFGTYEGMPDTLSVLVEGFDEGSMNTELRRRCRWLSHLPTGADVVFVEVDLARIVSRASLEPYTHAVKMRRTKRRDKAKREDKAKAKAEQREQDARPVYETSYSSQPAFDLPNFPAVLSPIVAAPPPRPPVAVEPTAAASSGNSTTVWGTRSFASSLQPHSEDHHRGGYDDDEFDERWHDFEETLSGGSGGRRGGNSNGGAANGGGGGGKKKGKKLVLNLSGASGRGRS